MQLKWVGSVLCVSLAACAASVDAPTQVDVSSDHEHEHPQAKAPLTCSGITPGPAPIRRLTRIEYNHTVRDLFGDTTEPANTFVREEEQNGFNNNADVLGVTPILAEQYMRAAEGVAERATQHLDTLIPCSTGGMDETTCVRQFIQTFGQKMYRGVLGGDDVDGLYAVFQAGRAEDLRTGIELVLQTMLQSSRFLYRVEFGRNSTDQPIVRLSSWEMASRLSYLFWNSMPDDLLFAAAQNDQLQTNDQILATAKRLIEDPKTQEAVANFHGQWLGLDALATASKSPSVFPAFSETIRAAMRTETDMFVSDVVWKGAGDLASMLTAPYSFMNAQLAAFYGLKGPTGEAFERVDLDPSQRVGLLTQASLLSINAHSDQTSPVTRGKFIRERFFCTEPPPPPPNVMAVAPDVSPTLTTRERFAQHSQDATCAACHQLMDPIGLGFENYDGVGEYRTLENGKVVDASGELIDTDVDGVFVGVPELGRRLVESQSVRDCVVTQWFRFSYGRSESADDACGLRSLQDQFDASGGNIRTLLLALTQTDAFLYRPTVVPLGDTP